jgi:hypothetical protein
VEAGGGARSRPVIVTVAVVVVAAGLAVRVLPGLVGDGAGGVLYAVLLYLIIVLISPTRPATVVALLAIVVGVAIELAQLTPIPAALADALPPARLVFGTTFAPLDLIWAVLGPVLAAGIDLALRRPRGRSGSLPTAERR